MSNPTASYSWSQPQENTDPFLAAFDTLISNIDTTVRSVENLAPTRASVVVSLFPSFPNSAGVPFPTVLATSWTICSAAPYGALQGSFSLLGSGAQAMFTLQLETLVQAGSAQVTSGSLPFAQMRVVVNPGSVSVPANVVNTSTDSGWTVQYPLLQSPQRTTLSAVTSLGTGKFAVQVQVEGVSPQRAGSFWQMAPGGVQLFVTEAVPAYP